MGNTDETFSVRTSKGGGQQPAPDFVRYCGRPWLVDLAVGGGKVRWFDDKF
jgi:hypothetical protein